MYTWVKANVSHVLRCECLFLCEINNTYLNKFILIAVNINCKFFLFFSFYYFTCAFRRKNKINGPKFGESSLICLNKNGSLFSARKFYIESTSALSLSHFAWYRWPWVIFISFWFQRFFYTRKHTHKEKETVSFRFGNCRRRCAPSFSLSFAQANLLLSLSYKLDWLISLKFLLVFFFSKLIIFFVAKIHSRWTLVFK